MEDILVFVIVFGIIALIIWGISKGIGKLEVKQKKSLTNNQFIKSYMYKCPEDMREEISNALNDEINKRPIPMFLTKNYLFIKKTGDVEVISLKNIVWMYGRETTYKTNHGNYMGTYNCVNLVLDGNIKKKFYIGNESLNYVIEQIAKNGSWILTGYSKSLFEDMKKNFIHYQNEKDKRYKDFISKDSKKKTN